MKNALRWFALFLALGTVLTTFTTLAVRAEDEKITGDLKKMQGTWVHAGDEGPDLKWTFKGNELRADVDGAIYVSKITLDSKATPNTTVDLMITEGPGNAAGVTVKGVYKFDGEKLIFCVSKPGGDKRPSEFKAVEDECYLFALKPEKN
jgi:uncharacterized protein (TIGR03067 family)